MATVIDFPSGHDVSCTDCDGPLAQDALCVVEVERTWRPETGTREHRTHRHLACAIPIEFGKMRRLLHALEPELLRDVLDEVEGIAPELAVALASRLPSAPIGDTFAGAGSLIEELEAIPGDRGLLQVLADHLLERGDERGELIALQLAGADNTRLDELIAALAPPHVADLAWGTGFLRALTLPLNARTFAAASVPLRHPSCRLLQGLTVDHNGYGPSADMSSAAMPRALRELEVSGGLVAGDLSLRLPHLTRLRIDTTRDLAHATVRELELHTTDRATVEACARGLPSVRRLKIECLPMHGPPPYELGILLEASGWFARLEQLDLQGLSRELLDGVERRFPNVRVTTALMRRT